MKSSLNESESYTRLENMAVSSQYGGATFIQDILISGIPKMSKVTGDQPREDLLKGKTLQVYWYLLTHGTAGVREIQKSLDFSSPGLVSYQLNKLINAGIISKHEESDKYFIKEEVKSGILGFYIRIGYRMVPRFSFYLGIFICGFIGFFLLALLMGDEFIAHPSSLMLFFFLITGTLAFVVESVRMRQLRPN